MVQQENGALRYRRIVYPFPLVQSKKIPKEKQINILQSWDNRYYFHCLNFEGYRTLLNYCANVLKVTKQYVVDLQNALRFETLLPKVLSFWNIW